MMVIKNNAIRLTLLGMGAASLNLMAINIIGLTGRSQVSIAQPLSALNLSFRGQLRPPL
jgi:hypothetical protein